MRNALMIKMIILISLGGFFSSCSQLEKATALLNQAQVFAAEGKQHHAKATKVYEKADEVFAAAEKKTAVVVKIFDTNKDGKVSEEEMKKGVSSGGFLALVMETYRTEGKMGVLVLLITLFIVWQGNHIFEFRKKFKQYFGGFLKRTGSIFSILSPDEERPKT